MSGASSSLGERTLAIGGVIVLGASTALRVTSDWDTFWHLRVGHEVLARRSTLPVDLFSFPQHGTPWPYKDVVADVILAAGFSRFGFGWFAFCKGMCVLALAFGAWRALPSPRPRPLLATAALGLLVGGVGYRIADRPLLFTIACAPIALALFERARRSPAGLGLLVGLCWVWAQLHREALVGVGLMFAFAQYLSLAALLHRRLGWLFSTTPTVRHVVLGQAAWLGALGVSLVNPSGLALYRSTFGVVGNAVLKDTISEWSPLPLGTLLRLLPLSCAIALAAGVVLLFALVSAWRRRAPGPLDAWHLGCWLLFCERTSSSVRWLPYLVIVSALILLLAAQAALTSAPRGLGALAAVLAGVAAIGVNPFPLGVGEQPDHYPSVAMRWAEQHGLHAHVANTLPFGGYVLWRGWPRFEVAVDGRNDMVYPAAYMLRCRDAERDATAFAELRRQDGADWVLAAAGADPSHRFLADDPAWALVLHGDVASIWVRRDAYPLAQGLPHVARLAHGDSLSTVIERAKAAGELPQLVGELERGYADDPNGVGAHLWLARAYDAAGDLAHRDEVMAHFIRVRPGYATGQDRTR